MKIERIDRASVRVLSDTAERALAAAFEPFGVTVKGSRAKYTNGSTGTITVDLIAAGANPGKESFERAAALLGFKPEDYGREFIAAGVRYRLTGIDLGKPKYPIQVERVRDGKGFKFTEKGALDGLARCTPVQP